VVTVNPDLITIANTRIVALIDRHATTIVQADVETPVRIAVTVVFLDLMTDCTAYYCTTDDRCGTSITFADRATEQAARNRTDGRAAAKSIIAIVNFFDAADDATTIAPIPGESRYGKRGEQHKC